MNFVRHTTVRIPLLLIAAVLSAYGSARAQHQLTLVGGLQMELQDESAVSAAGGLASYHYMLTPTVHLGVSAGYSSVSENAYYIPFSAGLTYRPFPEKISPVMGLELGFAYYSVIDEVRTPFLLAPFVGGSVPLTANVGLEGRVRADVLTQHSNWWGFLGYMVGLSFRFPTFSVG